MALKKQITVMAAMMVLTTACHEENDGGTKCHSLCKDSSTVLLCDDDDNASVEATCKNGCLNNKCSSDAEQENCSTSICSDDTVLARCNTETGIVSDVECKYGCVDGKCASNPDVPGDKCEKTYCIDDKTLSECDTETGASAENVCKNGCKDDQCLSNAKPETNNCTESICLDDVTLSQCNPDTGTATEMACKNGCRDSKCLSNDTPESNKCAESVCKDSTTLSQCDTDTGVITVVGCKNGCANGKCRAGDAPAPAAKPDYSEFIEQPATEYFNTTMSGRQGDIDTDNLPNAKAILATDRNDISKYGLYIWAWEYTQNKNAIDDVGFGYLRFGGTMSDEAMKELASRPEQKFFYTYSIKKNDDETDDVFVDRYVTGLMDALKKYGPNGSFFKSNPDVPNHPINAVEIMNEPNFGYMIPDNPNEATSVTEEKRQKLYAKLLPAAYDAVKKDYPDVTVIGFGAGGASAGDIRFVKKVLEFNPEVINKMDVFSTHPYVNGSPFSYSIQSWGQYSIASTLAAHRALFEKSGRADLPVLYSEMGWQITKADGGKYDTAANKTVTPTVQAAHIVQTYALSMRLNVLSSTIMFAVDTDSYNGGFFSNGKYRTSADAVKTMHALLPDPKLVSIRSDGEDGVFSYDVESEKKGSVLTMVFAPGGAQTYDYQTTASVVTVTDMVGHSTTFDVENGVVALPAGPCPLYIDESPTLLETPAKNCDCSTKQNCTNEELAECQSTTPTSCDCATGGNCTNDEIKTCNYDQMISETLQFSGNNYRLKKVIEKARAGEDVYIAAIGGSVTSGSYVDQSERYPTLVSNVFAELYAKDKNKVHLVNAGIGGTTSALGVIRYDRDVVKALGHNPDILILEYMANNREEDDSFINSYEGIIRHTLRLDNQPALINLVVASATHYTAYREKTYYKTLEEYYSTPIINLSEAVESRIDSGMIQASDYFKDKVHPTAYGFQITSDAIQYYFEHTDAETIASKDAVFPQKPYKSDAYDQIVMIEKIDSQYNITTGGFDKSEGVIPWGFSQNWLHDTTSENTPFTLKLECRTLLLAYILCNDADYGKADIYVDGKLIKTLDGGSGSSSGVIDTSPIIADTKSAEHTVDIKMASGSENKKFAVVAIGYGM